MAFFLFIDESGIDGHESPYEVLCGVSVQDDELWNFVSRVRQLEIDCFGVRYGSSMREIKARKFLKRKVFSSASRLPEMHAAQRRTAAKACLVNGQNASKEEMVGLSQAKLAYVKGLLELCAGHRLKVFAAISSGLPRSEDSGQELFLRKDYVYLFERFYYFLEDMRRSDQGIVVFDEIGKAKSHILLSQMDAYFIRSTKGRQRSSLVIPEPFFVQSDLSIGVQVADIIAYLISWGFRVAGMDKPVREELRDLVEMIKPLRFRTLRDGSDGENWEVWGVTYIKK